MKTPTDEIPDEMRAYQQRVDKPADDDPELPRMARGSHPGNFGPMQPLGVPIEGIKL